MPSDTETQPGPCLERERRSVEDDEQTKALIRRQLDEYIQVRGIFNIIQSLANLLAEEEFAGERIRPPYRQEDLEGACLAGIHAAERCINLTTEITHRINEIVREERAR